MNVTDITTIYYYDTLYSRRARRDAIGAMRNAAGSGAPAATAPRADRNEIARN